MKHQEDLCARIDVTIAAPVFGEPSPERPTEDRIGSSHQCVQPFHGVAVGSGWDGLGVVQVRVLGFDTPEALEERGDRTEELPAATARLAGQVLTVLRSAD